MLIEPERTLTAGVQQWLARFEEALAGSDLARLRSLFVAESYWRDLLALTWDIRTVCGVGAIAEELHAHVRKALPARFEVDPDRSQPRHVTRAGTACVEAIVRFESALGCGSGVLRLEAVAGRAPKAWTLLTALNGLTAFPERVGRARPTGQSYVRDFRGPNWQIGRAHV